MLRFVLPAAMALIFTAQPSLAQQTSNKGDRKDLAITIYNEDLALVRDRRSITFEKGETRLAFEDVSARIRPETAAFTSRGLSVIEQNFDFDLLTPAKLLEKAVGSSIRITRINPATGAETQQTAFVLSVNNGAVLQIGDSIEVLREDGLPTRVIFDKVPDNLRARPTLSMLVNAQSAGAREAELAYLTHGLSWQADYVGQVNENENEMTLSGLITLTNRAGVAFENALTQVVAGDVNVVRKVMAYNSRPEMRAMAAQAVDEAQQESIGDYHLYTLPRRTTVAHNQTKQVSFLTAPNVKLTKRYLYKPQGLENFDEFRSVSVEYAFDNRENSGLGKPLPKGIVRLYLADSNGSMQFIGEDHIRHTPKDESVKLAIGNAFDITVRAGTVTRETIARSRTQETQEITQAYVFKNAKNSAVSVEIEQAMWGDWTLLSASHEGKKRDAYTLVFNVPVPANGETRLEFKFRVVQ